MRKTLAIFLLTAASLAAQSQQAFGLWPVNMNTTLIHIMGLAGAAGGAYVLPNLQLIIVANGTTYDGYQVTWQAVTANGPVNATHTVAAQSGGFTLDIVPNVDAVSFQVTVTGYRLAAESRAQAIGQ